MLTLLIIGLATAFILAMLSPVVDTLALLINPVAVNSFFSLASSSITGLLYDLTWKDRVGYGLAGAFLGKLLLTIADKVTTSHTIVNNTRF